MNEGVGLADTLDDYTDQVFRWDADTELFSLD